MRHTDAGLDRDSKHLWTVVEGDDGLYALSGWHFVNRLGYLLTKEPWAEDTEAVWALNPEDDDPDEEIGRP